MDHSEVCRAWRTRNRAGRDEAGGCKAGREESAEKSEQMECHRRECGEAVRKRDRSGSTSVMKWKEALEYARQLDVKMIPYEKAAG